MGPKHEKKDCFFNFVLKTLNQVVPNVSRVNRNKTKEYFKRRSRAFEIFTYVRLGSSRKRISSSLPEREYLHYNKKKNNPRR